MAKSVLLVFVLLCISSVASGQECSPDNARRREVTNTRDSPNKYICLLSVKRQSGRFQSTGFLIAPRIILTAAHNIHKFSITSYPKRITITPGASYSDEIKDPFGTFEYEREKLKIITHRDYKGNKTRKSDFGIIILPDDSIYKKLGGYLTVDTYERSLIDSLRISGYPGDKDYGTQWTEATASFYEKNGMLVYDLFTHTGLSGAPVFYRNKSQNGYVAVGIHNTGKLNGTKKCNAATQIDAEVKKLLTKWQSEYGHLPQ